MKIPQRSLAALPLAAMVAFAGFYATVDAQDQKKPAGIHVEVNLVNILASVIDANGEPVPDLPQDAFELKEEGVTQKIERFEAQTNRPLDLALMVDSSMSTFKDMKFEIDAGAPGRLAVGLRILRFRYPTL
jgi:hypothetical protein